MTNVMYTHGQEAARLLDQIAEMGPTMARHAIAQALAEARREAFAEASAIAGREIDPAEAIRLYAGIGEDEMDELAYQFADIGKSQ